MMSADMGHCICHMTHEENIQHGLIKLTPHMMTEMAFNNGKQVALDGHDHNGQHCTMMHVIIVDPEHCGQ